MKHVGIQLVKRIPYDAPKCL